MRHLLIALGMYGSFVLHAELPARVTNLIDLLAMTGFVALLMLDDWRGLAWLGVAGFLTDCLNSGRLGPCLAAATIAGFVVQRLRFSDRPPWMVAACAAGVVAVIRCALVASVSFQQGSQLHIPAWEIAGCAGATASLALLLALLFRVEPRRERNGSAGRMQSFARSSLVPDSDA